MSSDFGKTSRVNRYRLPLLALVVAALVAVVALVAHGRPLAASSGRGGLPTSFWDYTLTSIVIVLALVGGAMLFVVIAGVPGRQRWTPPPHTRSLLSLVGLSLFVGLAFLLRRWINFGQLFHRFQGQQHPIGGLGHGKPPRPPAASTSTSTTWFRWDELAVVAGLLLVAAVVLFVVTTRRRGTPRAWNGAAPAALAAALDESLDDLRADPDVRRAIIAAYARMETALAAVGVPRRPAEAPLEYLERVLLALDTSQTSVRRLTDLFQWARFSHHEPEASMRDEAIDALVAVRDELRAPAGLAA